MTQNYMAESEIIRIRIKPEIKTKLLSIKEFAGFSDISKTVRQLIETGVSFYQQREKVITEMQEQIKDFTIQPNELYPDIQLKRKYLGI